MYMLLYDMTLLKYLITGMVETDPEGALAGFDQVVRMEPEKAEW
jgi:COP9 signalosome complex subunit 2